jgi:hypothetical protein
MFWTRSKEETAVEVFKQQNEPTLIKVSILEILETGTDWLFAAPFLVQH